MWTRRSFLQAAAVAGAGAVLTGSHAGCSAKTSPRSGLGNLFMENDKPVLVVVEGDNLQKMLEAGLNALGGLEKLVPGKKVVLKPNVVASQPPPVTTDIELMVSLAKLTQTSGAKSVTVCDSNSSGVSKAGKFEGLGHPPRLKDAGVRLDAVDFGDRLAHVFVEKKTWQTSSSIGVARTLQEADVIINLPVIKRHAASRFTCALKNHFGSVYGPLRFVAHRKMENEEGGKLFFDRAIAEFADAVRPELNIVDGRSMLIRGGPSLSGKAEVRNGVNKIVLCGDMVAADVYCSKLMEQYDDSYSSAMIADQLAAAEQLGLGVRDLNNVVVKEVVA
jgi:uncharacterized protein (DUF362 family)